MSLGQINFYFLAPNKPAIHPSMVMEMDRTLRPKCTNILPTNQPHGAFYGSSGVYIKDHEFKLYAWDFYYIPIKCYLF